MRAGVSNSFALAISHTESLRLALASPRNLSASACLPCFSRINAFSNVCVDSSRARTARSRRATIDGRPNKKTFPPTFYYRTVKQGKPLCCKMYTQVGRSTQFLRLTRSLASRFYGCLRENGRWKIIPRSSVDFIRGGSGI